MRSSKGGCVAIKPPTELPSRLPEKWPAGLLGVRSVELRTEHQPADFLQGAGQSVRIAGELDGSGVSQKFALAAHGGLDEPAKKDADKTDDDQREPKQRQRIFLPARPEQNSPDNGQAKDSEDQAHEAQIEPHVAVQDVAEFVTDDALQLIAGKQPHAAARHADGGITRGMTGGKGVDAGFVLQEINLRDGNTGGDGHLFHDVQELALIRFDRVRIDQAAIQHLRDRAAAPGEFESLGDAANRNDGEGSEHAPEKQVGLPKGKGSFAERIDDFLASENGKDRGVRSQDQEANRDDEIEDQQLGLAPGFVLTFEEIHDNAALRSRSCGLTPELEFYFRSFLLFGGLDDEEFGRREIEHARENIGRENFAARVVGRDRIIVSLAGERHLVLRGSELFHQGHHSRVRFEIGIRLRERKQPAQCPGQGALGAGEIFHRGGVAGILSGAGIGGGGGVSRGNDRFECPALMREIAFGGLDQIRDEIVAPLELHVDLRIRVFVSVPQCNQAVVKADDEQHQKEPKHCDHAE